MQKYAPHTHGTFTNVFETDRNFIPRKLENHEKPSYKSVLDMGSEYELMS